MEVEALPGRTRQRRHRQRLLLRSEQAVAADGGDAAPAARRGG